MSETVEKKELVPKLRFPEFRGEWDTKSVASICQLRAGDFVRAEAIQERSDSRLFPCYGGNGLRGYVEGFTHDGTFPLIGRQGALCGNVQLATGRFHATEHAVVATPKESIDVKWLTYTLARMNLNKFATGQAQPGLSVEVLNALRVLAPKSLAEQKKIAECLESLDELISAEADKLVALKRHKKGLLQQLFPTEGETIPRLRFPGFRSSGEWDTKTLDEISPAIFDGTHQTPTYVDEGVPFYSVENLISGRANKFISREDYEIATRRNKPEKGDVLITRIGNIGYAVHVDWDFDFSIYVTLAVIKSSPTFSSKYLAYYLQSDTYQKEIESVSLLTAVPCKVNMEALRQTAVMLPTLREQIYLADVLDDVDKAIVGDSDYLASLRMHKVALMQQLFPSIEE